jgi:hypothetical protein
MYGGSASREQCEQLGKAEQMEWWQMRNFAADLQAESGEVAWEGVADGVVADVEHRG